MVHRGRRRRRGFSAQWDANFVPPVRALVIAAGDEHRSMDAVHAAVPSEIDGGDPENWFAVRRSTLAAALGREFLQGGWFQDTVPLDWDKTDEYQGILRLYRDLILLWRNVHGTTRGLTGQGLLTYHVNDADAFVAFQRWAEHGPGDDVLVLRNFANVVREGCQVGFPAVGEWQVRLNTASRGYSPDVPDVGGAVVVAEPGDDDGLPASGRITIGPYSVLVLSQDSR